MSKCVYCGKEIEKNKYYAMAITRTFPVCSKECKGNAEKYVSMDIKFKKFLYIIVFAVSMGLLITTLFLNKNPKIMNSLIIVCGVAFLTLPYPITSFETFNRSSIKKTTLTTRIIGLGLILFGLFMILML